jgi:hypothetical protein
MGSRCHLHTTIVPILYCKTQIHGKQTTHDRVSPANTHRNRSKSSGEASMSAKL